MSNRQVSMRGASANAQQQQLDVNAERTAVICATLKSLYSKYVFPLEKKYQYDYFFESPFLSDAEFDGMCLQCAMRMVHRRLTTSPNVFTLLLAYLAKPQVLLVGQYSVGKTSFIRYLLGRDFPGQRIGPEPTTDRFTGENYGTKLELSLAS